MQELITSLDTTLLQNMLPYGIVLLLLCGVFRIKHLIDRNTQEYPDGEDTLALAILAIIVGFSITFYVQTNLHEQRSAELQSLIADDVLDNTNLHTIENVSHNIKNGRMQVSVSGVVNGVEQASLHGYYDTEHDLIIPTTEAPGDTNETPEDTIVEPLQGSSLEQFIQTHEHADDPTDE